MNNNFYSNSESNMNINNSPKKSRGLGLMLFSIVLIVVGYILMTTGIFNKVESIETTVDKKVVYEGDKEPIKVKVNKKSNFSPKVRFKSKNGNIKFSDDVQMGEEVETKIIGTDSGEDTVIIEVETENGNKVKKEEVEILVCKIPQITNTTDEIINIKENEKIELKYNVSSECLDDYEIYVENEKIATLEDNILVAKKAGKTNLILKRQNTRVKYILNVAAKEVKVEKVRINNNSLNLALGKTKKIVTTVLPTNANNRKVRYESNDEEIAIVTDEGKIEGVGVGSTEIKVISEENENKTASIKVKVYNPKSSKKTSKPESKSVIKVESLLFNQNSYKIEEKESKNLVVEIKPAKAENKEITCTSDDNKIATVTTKENMCVVTGVKAGETTIKVVSKDGQKVATTKVTVNKKIVIVNVTSISFDKKNYEIYVSETKTLGVSVLPTDANNKEYVCTSSDPNVAKIVKGCEIKGLKAGEVVIEAVSKDGNKKAETNVTVTKKPEQKVVVTGIKFDKKEHKIYVGESTNLTTTITPSNATNKVITCASNDEKVATVTVSNNACVVKGLAKGNATITVKSKDQSKTDIAQVTISEKTVVVTGIKFDKKEHKIYVGESANLTTTITPSNATNKGITCTSSNQKIATVTANNNACIAKGLAPGPTKITASTKDGSYKATVELTVVKKITTISVTSISFDKKEYKIYTGDAITLGTVILPSNATNKGITCTSSDDKIVSVTTKNNGCDVKGLVKGSATIKATTKDGGYKSSTKVIVADKVTTISVASIKFNTNVVNINRGSTKNLEVIFNPSNATNQKITCKSLDEKIATVSTNKNICIIKGIAKGTTTVEAYSKDGNKKATATINVVVPVTGVTTNQKEYTIEEGKEKEIKVSVLPSDATNKNYTCTSNNGSVAQVVKGCLVKGLKPGSATIKVVSKDGSKSTSVKVNVNKKIIKVTGVKFDKASETMYIGDTSNITTTVTPSNATNKEITCKSDNSNIATATTNDNTCIVKGLSKGIATIIATTKDGNKTSSIKVTVKEKTPAVIKVTGIKFDKTSEALYVGDTKNIGVTITPSNATNKEITCKSNDEKVATVTKNNNSCAVKGIAIGNTIITVTTKDGNKTASIKVAVNKRPIVVTDVKFESTTYSMYVSGSKTITPKITPSNATNKKITCTSSNQKAATVTSKDGSCVLKGIASGGTIITATTEDGNKKATTKVTVSKKVTKVAVKSISFEKTSYSVAYKGTINIVVGITPSNATNKGVTCKSLNTKVATATSKGNTCTVTGIAPGEATIEATSSDGAKKATTKVKVGPIKVTQIKFEKDSYNINTNETKDLKVNIIPTNASNKAITCTSSNQKAATASAKGASCSVKGIAVGSATIEATSQDGSKKATTTITVKEAIKKEKIKVATFNVGGFDCGGYYKSNKCKQYEWCYARNDKGECIGGVNPTKIADYIKKDSNLKDVSIIGFQESSSNRILERMNEIINSDKNIDKKNLDRYVASGLPWDYKIGTINVAAHGIISRIPYKYFSSLKLTTCDEYRYYDKVVYTINGVDISVYNTHLGLGTNGVCNDEGYKKLAEVVKSDSNPVIMTGDFNRSKSDRYNNYLKPFGFVIAAHDDSGKSMNTRKPTSKTKDDYMDSIFVRPYGSNKVNHINVVPNSSKVLITFDEYTDHNLVIATLEIY